MASWVQFALLVLCWISALVTLVVFLESWFALKGRTSLAKRRSAGAHGVVSALVLLPRGARNSASVQTILDQSYPFVELLLVYDSNDPEQTALVREAASVRSHVPVRPTPVPFPIESESDRLRALDQVRSGVHGSWILVLDFDLVLDEYALESALEFAESEEITAMALTPGVECRSLAQRLLAPSLEWFVRMIRAVDRGREKSDRPAPRAPFLLFHGPTHTVINKINRMPGVLNEAGWTLWSYRVEGLRTFYGDGSGWISKEASVQVLGEGLESSALGARRVAAFVLGSAAVSVVSLLGVGFGLLTDSTGFPAMGILYFSAFSYGLMATGYFCYSRRLGGASWFAPLWFISHAVALVLVLERLARHSEPSAPIPVPADPVGRVPTR